MMLNRKSFGLLIFIFITSVIPACSETCPDTTAKEFSFESYSLKPAVVTGIIDEGSIIYDIDLDFTNKKIESNFPFLLQLQGSEITYSQVNYQPNWNINLFSPSAKASSEQVCSSYDFPKHNISSIKIYSDSDFNDSYPAGTDLSALFLVWSSYSKIINDPFSLSKVNSGEIRIGESALTQLVLKTKPDHNLSHSFRVEVTREDGRYFELITDSYEFEIK